MKPLILCVDNEPNILFPLQEYFTLQGYEVHCAESKEAAYALIAQTSYDAVLLDLCLTSGEDFTGLELVEHIRQRWPFTWVLMLSAYGSEETMAEARAHGVDHYLIKPLRLSSIERLLRGLLQQAA